jgi:NADPH-dependent 2,4-dienoyl-CoA reductase/sulfur reductase-like enzyme
VNHANPSPVAVIGAGPVGLAAAAHLLDRGLQPVVFEAGATVGASIRAWGHVRVFSPCPTTSIRSR